MSKALCFLGTGPPDGKYKSTTYVKHDDCTKTHETDLFPEAVFHLYNPKKIVVFVTPQVQAGDNLDKLKENLGCELETVELPDLLDRGNSEEDLWRIFDTYQKSVDERDKIILDITHGFRSLPMLAFPVVAYLQQVKQVTLEHIRYAPFDARPESKGKNTPIFDLTPFVTLLDWMNAVKIFQHSGDARPIAELRVPEGIDNADKISKSLTNLSAALLTNLPLEAQKAAFEFDTLDLSQNKPSQAPFGILIGSLKETYKDMAVDEPGKHLKESLKSQYEQIKWYVKNRHYFQAITLIREWLVSWECQRARPENPGWLNANRRNDANKRLNEHTENYFGKLAKKLAEECLHASFEDVRKHCVKIREKPENKFVGIDLHLTIIKLWEDCKTIRNSLAHCGMDGDSREDETAQTFEDISKEVERLSGKIKYLQNIYKEFINSQNCKEPGEILKIQREQIEWYIDNKHYLHAITLVREWLINWECYRDNSEAPNWSDRQKRNEATSRLKTRGNFRSSKALWDKSREIRKEISNFTKNLQNQQEIQSEDLEWIIKKIQNFREDKRFKNLYCK